MTGFAVATVEGVTLGVVATGSSVVVLGSATGPDPAWIGGTVDWAGSVETGSFTPIGPETGIVFETAVDVVADVVVGEGAGGGIVVEVFGIDVGGMPPSTPVIGG